MKLSEAKIKYANQWLAFYLQEENEDPEGEVLLHNPNRHLFDKELLAKNFKNIYITFAGPPNPEGYAVIF